MTKADKLELNRLGLIKEYKHLNRYIGSFEASCRQSDILRVLMDTYHMSESEIEALDY